MAISLSTLNGGVALASSQNAAAICEADKAAAVGRLMLGQISDLEDYFGVARLDYSSLPRRMRRSGARDVRGRMEAELGKFCRNNFEGMTVAALAKLYDASVPHLKTSGVFALGLQQFVANYAGVKDKTLGDAPQYATVVMSVRGLEFLFPEYWLASDLRMAIKLLMSDIEPVDQQWNLSRFASCSCIASCFGLLEGFLNGLVWEAAQVGLASHANLTAKQREILAEPTRPTLRDKLLNVPVILTGSSLPKMDELDRLIDKAKRFRDSLTHPSPFAAPTGYGGYDKLEHFYSINRIVAVAIMVDALAVMDAIFRHIGRTKPRWFEEILTDCNTLLDMPTAVSEGRA